MLALKNCCLSFAERQVFDALSFEVLEGEVCSIVGPSGAGKSSLLKVLAGKLIPQAGDVYFKGNLLAYHKQLIAGNDEIAYVSQEFKEDDYFTVSENIQRKLLHLAQNDRVAFLKELLELADLTLLKDVPARFLSGGEKQRLTLVCALASEPKIVLLDEPFAHLDVHLKNKIGQYLKTKAKQEDLIVVLVTHFGEEALTWSDHIWFMNNGQLISKYGPEEAYFEPKNQFEGLFFGELNSVWKNGKEILFRPNQFSLIPNGNTILQLKFRYAEFRGAYYANYFSGARNVPIVLYAQEILSNVKRIYAGK